MRWVVDRRAQPSENNGTLTIAGERGEADSTHEFGQLAVVNAIALGIAVLNVHPLTYPMIDPAEMRRTNRQATLVRLARVRQDSQ